MHVSGKPFTDPSGERLRAWMGVSETDFYDVKRVAIIPMGFCFPGLDANGADLPPRRECAPLWRSRLLSLLPRLDLVLLVGQYAQRWHLPGPNRSLTDTVAAWRDILDAGGTPRFIPVPHPSWRNNSWLKKHPWFEAELLPRLRDEVGVILRGQ